MGDVVYAAFELVCNFSLPCRSLLPSIFRGLIADMVGEHSSRVPVGKSWADVWQSLQYSSHRIRDSVSCLR